MGLGVLWCSSVNYKLFLTLCSLTTCSHTCTVVCSEMEEIRKQMKGSTQKLSLGLLWKELQVFSKLLFRGRNQHRRDKSYQRLLRVCCTNLCQLIIIFYDLYTDFKGPEALSARSCGKPFEETVQSCSNVCCLLVCMLSMVRILQPFLYRISACLCSQCYYLHSCSSTIMSPHIESQATAVATKLVDCGVFTDQLLRFIEVTFM